MAGAPDDRNGNALRVSVPFARGTPPWLRIDLAQQLALVGFSPLREGDTSVAAF